MKHGLLLLLLTCHQQATGPAERLHLRLEQEKKNRLANTCIEAVEKCEDGRCTSKLFATRAYSAKQSGHLQSACQCLFQSHVILSFEHEARRATFVGHCESPQEVALPANNQVSTTLQRVAAACKLSRETQCWHWAVDKTTCGQKQRHQQHDERRRQ